MDVAPSIDSLDEMPLTASGKVDTVKLADMPLPVEREATCDTSGLDPVERELLNVWREVLENAECGADDDFFEIGGTSLAMFQMLAAAQARGIVIPPAVAVKGRTITGIVAELARTTESLGADGRFADELRADIQAEATELRRLVNCQNSSEPRGPSTQPVLLTGATGFLGCRVLDELLRQSDQAIICLVRSPSDAHAERRLRSWLEEQRISLSSNEWSRIRCLAGDVSVPQLGLSRQTWCELADGVSSIYHCAARVNVLDSPTLNFEPTMSAGSLRLHGSQPPGCLQTDPLCLVALGVRGH